MSSSSACSIETVRRRAESWGALIAFAHSVFALPFAILMIAIVSKFQDISLLQVSLLIVCVVAARTAAMAFNRVIDADIDAANVRTVQREIPSARVSRREGMLLAVCAAVVFLAGSAMLGVHCLVCAPAVLLILFGYSFFKRFSALCHIVLGCALACAPGGVWYALTGRFSLEPIPLMASVLFWVAGFDILYSLQDADFDRTHGLHSFAVSLGSRKARWLSGVLHILSVVLLGVNGEVFSMGFGYWLGVGLFACSVAMQHLDVARHGVSVIGKAFFTRNGIASVVLCCGTLAEVVLLG